jgi:hypothetical protein
LGERAGLLGGGDLPGEEEPEHTLRDDLFAAGCSREDLLAIGDGEAVEADTLDGGPRWAWNMTM